MRCEFAAKPGQIESSIDLPHQMIFRSRVVELKLVEKLRLSALQPTHHGLPPPRFASARWNHCSPHASTDFCNKIGHWATSPSVMATSASPREIVSNARNFCLCHLQSRVPQQV